MLMPLTQVGPHLPVQHPRAGQEIVMASYVKVQLSMAILETHGEVILWRLLSFKMLALHPYSCLLHPSRYHCLAKLLTQVPLRVAMKLRAHHKQHMGMACCRMCLFLAWLRKGFRLRLMNALPPTCLLSHTPLQVVLRSSASLRPTVLQSIQPLVSTTCSRC